MIGVENNLCLLNDIYFIPNLVDQTFDTGIKKNVLTLNNIKEALNFIRYSTNKWRHTNKHANDRCKVNVSVNVLCFTLKLVRDAILRTLKWARSGRFDNYANMYLCLFCMYKILNVNHIDTTIATFNNVTNNQKFLYYYPDNKKCYTLRENKV